MSPKRLTTALRISEDRLRPVPCCTSTLSLETKKEGSSQSITAISKQE